MFKMYICMCACVCIFLFLSPLCSVSHRDLLSFVCSHSPALLLLFKHSCYWSLTLLIVPAPKLTGGVVNGQFLDFLRMKCR